MCGLLVFYGVIWLMSDTTAPFVHAYLKHINMKGVTTCVLDFFMKYNMTVQLDVVTGFSLTAGLIKWPMHSVKLWKAYTWRRYHHVNHHYYSSKIRLLILVGIDSIPLNDACGVVVNYCEQGWLWYIYTPSVCRPSHLIASYTAHGDGYWPVAQIQWCVTPLSHNTAFFVRTCVHIYVT